MKLFFTVCFFLPAFIFSQDNISVNQKAPEIIITDWIQNKPSNIDLSNKFIVLEFWATWCKPCIKNVEHLNLLQNNIKRDDLLIISITNEEPYKVKKLLEIVNFESIVVSDQTNKTQIAYGDGVKGIKILPLTVLINKRGVIKWIGTPDMLTEAVLNDFIDNNISDNKKNIIEKKLKEYPTINKNNYLHKLIKLAKNDTLDYYYDIKESSKSKLKGINRISSKKLFYVKGWNLRQILNNLFDYKSQQILMDEKLNHIFYDIIYKNNNYNQESLVCLERDILNYLNVQKSSIKKEIKAFQVSIINNSLLKHSELKSKSKLRQGDMLLLFRYTLKDLIREINLISDDFYVLDSIDTNFYDFSIDINSIEESIKNHGMIIESNLNEIEAYNFSKK